MDALPPYVIQEDRGGRLVERVRKAAELSNQGRSVRIDGLCASACTVYLVFARERRVCVGPGAVLAFHQVTDARTGRTNPRINNLLMSLYPRSVQNWIRARGGLTAKLLVMTNAEARQHIRPCP